jgi:hypothetical protein
VKDHIRVELGCTHERWFIPAALPHAGERIWCPRCERYETVGPEGVEFGRSYQEEFWSEPFRTGYRGGCLFDGCGFVSTGKVTNWFRLREIMHAHYMREHTRFGATVFAIVDRLPKNSPPPF